MPRNERSRRRSSRYLPPRPTVQPAPRAEAAPGGSALPASAAGARDEARAVRTAEREMLYLGSELRRVAGVSAVCLGLLAVLVALDRLA